MSVHDETWDRPICNFCKLEIPYGEKSKHINRTCIEKTKIVNIKSGAKYDVYCGRAGYGKDGYYGNPHPIGYCKICDCSHNRDTAIDSFKYYFRDRINKDTEYKEKVDKLKNQILGCFCAPNRCHCEIYVDYLNNPEKYLYEKVIND